MPAAERHYRLWLLLVWLASATLMIAASWGAIAAWRFPDPDDAMRLAQVRDWMAGQSWFDVSQHRMNLPHGLSMHWSRWLDVPIAGSVALFAPLLGRHGAETLTMVAVPMITLGATQLLVAEIARRQAGAAAGLTAAACCLASIGIWYAMRPLRIDHHGWQIVAGLGLVVALLRRRDWRGAVVAGLCGAAWVHISLEGLAFVAGAAAWLGLRWIAAPAERYRLPAFLASLVCAETLLYLSVHGVALVQKTFCDQVSPVHLDALGAAALITFAAARAAPRSMATRLLALAIAAVVTGALYRGLAPQCASGPFAALGPLGYHLWYRSVPEGIPLWRLGPNLAILWGLFPWIGLAGAIVGWRRAQTNRDERLDFAALVAIAAAIGLFVTRAGAFANLLAVPGAITLILLLIARTDDWRLLPRVLARTVAILALTPAGAGVAAMLATPSVASAPPSHTRSDPDCGLASSLKALDALPPSTILTPLDLGPSLLVGTHHTAITGPYHRDPAALEDVLRFFTAADAKAIALRRHVGFVAFCPDDGEMAAMAKLAPGGLAAQSLHGQVPGWLSPVRLPNGAGLQLYRVGLRPF